MIRSYIRFTARLLVASSLSLLSWASTNAAAQAGLLDPSWGTNSSVGSGKVVTAFNGSDALGKSAALQPDGKLVVAGNCQGAVNAFCVARYLSDGSLDVSFNSTGVVVTSGNGNQDVAYAVALQQDGKIVVVGGCLGNSGRSELCARRYSPRGTLDATFGAAGQVRTAILGFGEFASVVAVQSDGRIMLAGSCPLRTGGATRFCAARYNGNGTLDSSFGDSGTVVTDVGSGGGDEVKATAIQPDGKIILVGQCRDISTLLVPFCAVRYTSTGVLDGSFNGNGKLVSTLGTSSESFIAALALQPDGKVLIAGYCNFTSSAAVACIARYKKDGSIDASFNSTGYVFAAPGSAAGAIALQQNSTIIVSGNCFTGSRSDFCTWRYTPDGQVDSSFNSTGNVQTRIDQYGTVNAIVVQPDGRILVAGTCRTSSSALLFCAARYAGDVTPVAPGTLDASWGPGGLRGAGHVITSVGTNSLPRAVAQQADGKLIVAGTCDSVFCAVRYDSAGALDNSFGTAGRVVSAVGGGVSNGTAVLIQADGKIIVAGYCEGANAAYAFCLIRYNSAGTIDTSFGAGGKVIGPSSAMLMMLNAAALQGDGKVLVAGACAIGSATQFCTARYTRDGVLDTSFHGSGLVATAVAGAAYSAATAVAQQADGKIVLGGTCRGSVGYLEFCAARYAENGELDQSFNGSGAVLLELTDRSSSVSGMALQADARIVLTGACDLSTSNSQQYCVARLRANGALDPDFNGSGWLRGSFGSSSDGALVAMQSDGKIVLTFRCSIAGGPLVMCLARYDGDGSLDRTMSRTGIATVPGREQGQFSDLITSIGILSDGKLVQTGVCTDVTTGNSNFCIQRYVGGPFGAQNCKLDIDGDGSVSYSVDMLIAIRVALGVKGDAVISGISFAGGATRKTWAAIREYLMTQCGINLPM